MSSSQTQLKVLTLNVWGLKYISKDRPPRIAAIAAHLASSSYDIVCLQELWIYSDYEIIREKVEKVLPYSRFFHTGALGSGLAIFTHLPIIAASALPYSLSGLPTAVIQGDFFVNKAAGSVVLLHPVLGEVEVWSTHMHAAGEHGPLHTQSHRLTQSFQLSTSILSSSARGRYTLACGDFNSAPSSLPVAIMRDYGGVVDAWDTANPGSAELLKKGEWEGGDEAAVEQLGMTCDNLGNTYSRGKPLTDVAKRWGGKRLDYIFYRQPEIARSRPLIWGYRAPGILEEGKPIEESLDNAPILHCKKCEVVLTGLVPGEGFSYSDHFGVEAVFEVLPSPAEAARRRGRGGEGVEEEKEGEFKALLPVDEPSSGTATPSTIRNPPKPTTGFSPHPTASATLSLALSTLRAYSVLSRSTSRLHLRLFSFSALLSLSLTTTAYFTPRYLTPLWVLLATASGAGGATWLYTGFVWGSWEENLLKEVMWGMELEIRHLEMEKEGGRGRWGIERK